MRILINGEPREVESNLSLSELLDSLGIKGERVAVELNQLVIRREARAAQRLQPDDELEIVSFVGGG